jgi:hypothetical protein
LGFVVATLLELSRQSWVLSILDSLTRRPPRALKKLERRKERARAARERPGESESELVVAALMCMVFAFLGFAFMLGVALTPSIDGKFFAAAISMSGFGLFTLFLTRVGYWQAIIVDVHRIDQLELELRHGHIPTNDP